MATPRRWEAHSRWRGKEGMEGLFGLDCPVAVSNILQKKSLPQSLSKLKAGGGKEEHQREKFFETSWGFYQPGVSGL